MSRSGLGFRISKCLRMSIVERRKNEEKRKSDILDLYFHHIEQKDCNYDYTTTTK